MQAAFLLAVLFSFCAAGAEPPRNTITFENQSGEPALVHLFGPSEQRLQVDGATKRTVHVAGGIYAIVTRYGADRSRYRYEKADPFEVEDGLRKFTKMTVPLAVPGSKAQPASREEFEHGGALLQAEHSKIASRGRKYRPLLQVSMGSDFRWDKPPRESHRTPGVASLGEDRGGPEFVGLTNIDDTWSLKAPKELELIAFVRAARPSPGGSLSLLVNDHTVWSTNAEPPKGTMSGFGQSDIKAEFMQTPVIDLKPYVKPGRSFAFTLRSRTDARNTGYAINALLVVGR